MSGGSDKKKKDRSDETAAPTPADLAAYQNAPVQRTFQPALPGALDRLGTQLQAGFGGNQHDFVSGLYQPMNMLQFVEPISTTRDAFDADKHMPIETGNPYLDELLMKKPDERTEKKKK